MRRTLCAVTTCAALLALASVSAAHEGLHGLTVPPEGFHSLFNGRDLTNWKGLVPIRDRGRFSAEELARRQREADASMRAHWTVEDGVLVYDGKGQSLQTARDYGDFELYLEWRILKDGDSGIYLRGNPQVQIWDNPIGSGGLYNNRIYASRPLAVADNPPGSWNAFFIRMKGDLVTIQLNGVPVVYSTPLENYWQRGEPLPERGPIELQHHGNRLEFRHIYLRELGD